MANDRERCLREFVEHKVRNCSELATRLQSYVLTLGSC